MGIYPRRPRQWNAGGTLPVERPVSKPIVIRVGPSDGSLSATARSQEQKRFMRKAIIRSVGPAAVALALLVAQGEGRAAPKYTHEECNINLKVCIKGCTGPYFDLGPKCTAACDLEAVKCHQQAPAKEASKPYKDAKPKKGIDASQPPGKWVPNSPKKKGLDGTPSTGKWVPNSPAKGKGVPSVPAGGTWNPSPSSGGKAQSLKSGGRR